jgi:predicted amidohydrolase
LRNGHLVDPSTGRDGRFDVAIQGRKIARVAERIRAEQGRMVVDVGDYYVTPGLVDSKIAVNFMASPAGLQPDQFCLPNGVTTVVASAGPDVVRRSRTRIVFAKAPEGALLTGADRDHPIGMTTVMTSLLASGTPFAKIVERGTVIPAKALGLTDAGTLREGASADLALFDIREGRVACVLTMRNGDTAWDLHGLTAREWTQAGPYTNHR